MNVARESKKVADHWYSVSRTVENKYYTNFKTKIVMLSMLQYIYIMYFYFISTIDI